MAERHHKSEIPASATTRAYTVSYVRDSRTYAPLPAITLRGNWLAEAGFSTGTPLAVKVLHPASASQLPRRVIAGNGAYVLESRT